MLIPKKTKFRKAQRGRARGKASRKLELSFGSFGMKALTNSWITSRQIEAARRVMTKYTKKGGRVWIRIFPHKPVTVKGSEVPMGGGKGSVDHYVAVVKKGIIMFEMAGISKEIAQEAIKLASYKLPVKTIFVSKE